MDGEDLTELLGWLVDCAAAAIAGGAAGWCLWLLGQGFTAVSIAAAVIAAATCGALRIWGSSGRHFRLPPFAVPRWVDALDVEPPLLDQPVDGTKIVRLHRTPRPAVVRGVAPPQGEVVPFAPDASAALKPALAQLRRVP